MPTECDVNVSVLLAGYQQRGNMQTSKPNWWVYWFHSNRGFHRYYDNRRDLNFLCNLEQREGRPFNWKTHPLVPQLKFHFLTTAKKKLIQLSAKRAKSNKKKIKILLLKSKLKIWSLDSVSKYFTKKISIRVWESYWGYSLEAYIQFAVWWKAVWNQRSSLENACLERVHERTWWP